MQGTVCGTLAFVGWGVVGVFGACLELLRLKAWDNFLSSTVFLDSVQWTPTQKKLPDANDRTLAGWASDGGSRLAPNQRPGVAAMRRVEGSEVDLRPARLARRRPDKITAISLHTAVEDAAVAEATAGSAEVRKISARLASRRMLIRQALLAMQLSLASRLLIYSQSSNENSKDARKFQHHFCCN